jgi:hypothetical protein
MESNRLVSCEPMTDEEFAEFERQQEAKRHPRSGR